LDLTEVSKAMKAGALAAMEQGLSYHEATDVYQRTMVKEAVEMNEGVFFRAAQQLKLAPAWVAKMFRGEVPKRKRGGGRKKEEQAG